MRKYITEYLTTYFDEIEPVAFYRSIFPTGELAEKGKQEQGKYNAIAVELLPTEDNNRQNARTHIITDDLEVLQELQESDNFIIISPISYIGRSRKSENARFIYAIAIDLDGITKEGNVRDLFHQIDYGFIPKPTYIVYSGTGFHLYYQLVQPLPCFKNIVKQLQLLKKDLTKQIWNGYVTSLEDNIQFESLFQGFRLVGGVCKDKKYRTRAFEIGEKVSIEYLNEFAFEESHKVTEYTYKSKLTVEQAKKKYPDWYEKRIVEKQPRGTWTTKNDLFYWWLDKLKTQATVGHRYYCVLCLAVYAKKAGIEREELERIAFDLVDMLESKTIEDDNHFTRQDILAALEAYNDSYIRFPIDTISRITDIPIEKNKRNFRKQSEHIKLMNFIRDELNNNKDWRNKEGRPTKEKIVIEWRRLHPYGSKAECARELQIDRKTVYKYWELGEKENG